MNVSPRRDLDTIGRPSIRCPVLLGEAPSPSQAPPAPPEVKVEKTADGVRIEEKLDGHTTIEGLEGLVKDHTIRSFSRTEDEVVVYADSPDAVKQLLALKRDTQLVKSGSLLDRMREMFVPPDMSETVAPEYLKFRAWCLAGALVSGTIGFMNTAVNLDATKIAFNTGQKAAIVGVVNGLVYKGAAVAESYIAHKGDINPKKWYLINSMVSSGNGLLNIGILSVYPHAYIPLNAFFNFTSAFTNTVGSAAGLNVFYHIAKGDNKGLVQSKNSNQDMMFDLIGGMPLGLGLTAIAHHIGMTPYFLTLALCGPAQIFCNLQAARALHFEIVDRHAMNRIADTLIDTGKVAEAPRPGLVATIRNLFRHKEKVAVVDPHTHMAGSLDKMVAAANACGSHPDALFGLFAGERYLLCPSGDKDVLLTFRKEATAEDVVKGFVHARFLERVLNSPLPGMIEKMGYKDRTILAELVYRGMPPEKVDGDQLIAHGWHANTESLQITHVDAVWDAPPLARVSDLATQDLLNLIASPDEKKLHELLDHPHVRPPRKRFADPT